MSARPCLPALLVLGLIVLGNGCTRSQVDWKGAPLPERQKQQVEAILQNTRDTRLLSVYLGGCWHPEPVLWERWVEGDTVYCRKSTLSEHSPDRSSSRADESMVYVIRDRRACAMLANLCDLVRGDFRFVSKGYVWRSIEAAGYHWVSGPRPGFSYVAGHYPEHSIGLGLDSRADQFAIGEEPEGGDRAYPLLDEQAYQSLAPAVARAIDQFDELCQWASSAARGAEHRMAPESDRSE